MDGFFTEILQIIVKALLIFLLARSSHASPKVVTRTHVDKRTVVAAKTVARPPQTKKASR